MGKKRKPEKTEEEIRRKIQKLENKLAKVTNQSRLSSSGDSFETVDSKYFKF